jgi:hypothetical protein
MTEQEKELEEFNNSLKKLLNSLPPKDKKQQEEPKIEKFNEEAS